MDVYKRILRTRTKNNVARNREFKIVTGRRANGVRSLSSPRFTAVHARRYRLLRQRRSYGRGHSEDRCERFYNNYNTADDGYGRRVAWRSLRTVHIRLAFGEWRDPVSGVLLSSSSAARRFPSLAFFGNTQYLGRPASALGSGFRFVFFFFFHAVVLLFFRAASSSASPASSHPLSAAPSRQCMTRARSTVMLFTLVPTPLAPAAASALHFDVCPCCVQQLLRTRGPKPFQNMYK